MQIAPEITFKEFTPSAPLTARIHELIARLEHIYDRIIRCQVLVEMPHKHHRQGRQFHVRVRLTVPGGEIVTSHDPGPDGAHEDPYVAVRDAFTAARRQLEDHVQRLRGEPKRHRIPRTGTIVFLDAEATYGWLEVDQNARVRFDRAAVVDGFDQLRLGDQVHFTEIEGEAITLERTGGSSERSPAM